MTALLNLLIVEDEETMREGLLTMIDWETIGIQICGVAANGMEALELFEKETIDLLLTDIRMPLMDGLQLIGELRKRGLDTDCVLLSGYNDFEYAKQAIRLGVSDFIVKPCSPREIRAIIVDRVGKIIERRRQSDSVQGMHENMPLLKSQLLRSWLHAPALVTENRKEQMKRLGIAISDRHPIVVAVQIDNRSRQKLNYNQIDFELIRLAAANIVQETLEQAVMQPVETIKEEDGIVVILNGIFEWIEEKLIRGLDRVQHNLKEYLKVTVSFGISDAKTDVNDLAEAYQEARQALEYRFFRGTVSHCFYRDAALLAHQSSPHEEGHDPVLMKLEYSAVENLRVGLYAEALNDIEQWLNALQQQDQQHYSRTEVNVRTLSLLTHLLQLVQGKALADGGLPLDFSSLEQQVSRIDTMEELAGFVYRMLQQVVEKLNPHRTPKRKVQQAINTIAEQYNAPGLSLAGVAKALFVSSTYLSTLFKQELGINFLDYIHQYRIEKAKVLLQRSDYKIQAVAREVGYFDEAHFTKTFKKWTGTLPSQYKKEHAPRP